MKYIKSVTCVLTTAMILCSINISSFAETKPNIERFSGSDRYKTSIETAKKIDSNKAVLASGKNFPDSISSSNLSNKGYKLILISQKNCWFE